MSSFFDNNYQTPDWFKQKLSRRRLLKSAAGASAMAAMPRVFASQDLDRVTKATETDPWLTLDATLNHLLPESKTGPSAKDIRASLYLYNVVHEQPTEQDEIDFIYKGVGWLNDFSQSQSQRNFVALTTNEKEGLLKAISRSRAGENWLSNLISYIFEAMLAPPVYGGNPNGIGWQWLDHQAGFPLPGKGKRYYELPGQQSIAITNISSEATGVKGSRKS